MPVANLEEDGKHKFLRLLQSAMGVFIRGKLVRKQPKAVYLPNIRARLPDETSYQLTKFGKRLLAQSKASRRLYFLVLLYWFWCCKTVKRLKQPFVVGSGAISLYFLSLQVTASVESAIVGILVNLFAALVGAIVGAMMSSEE